MGNEVEEIDEYIRGICQKWFKLEDKEYKRYLQMEH